MNNKHHRSVDAAVKAYWASFTMDDEYSRKEIEAAIDVYLAEIISVETELPAVKVKALEWVEHGDLDFVWHRAMPPIGFRYNIEDDGFSEKKHHLTVGQLVIGNFDTLDEAKTAAQQDYSARILSALVPSTPAESRCEELVKALEEALEVFEIYADPTGYTDGHGDLWPSDAEQHEGLLAKGAADKIRAALASYRKASDDLKEAEGVGR